MVVAGCIIAAVGAIAGFIVAMHSNPIVAQYVESWQEYHPYEW